MFSSSQFPSRSHGCMCDAVSAEKCSVFVLFVVFLNICSYKKVIMEVEVKDYLDKWGLAHLWESFQGTYLFNSS